MLKKVVSTGFTSGDVATLNISKLYGIETGGYAVKNYMDSNGNFCPHYKDEFNLDQIDNYNYINAVIKNQEISRCCLLFHYGETNVLNSNVITPYLSKIKKQKYSVGNVFSQPHTEASSFVEYLKKYNFDSFNVYFELSCCKSDVSLFASYFLSEVYESLGFSEKNG